MPEEPPPPKQRESRWLLIGAVGVLVLAGLAIFFGQMNLNKSSPGTVVTSTEAGNKDKSVVTLGVTVEAINPSSGFASLRLSAYPSSDHLPKEGAVIFSSLGGAPAIVVRPEQFVIDATSQIPFSSGSVGDYPFETYQLRMAFVVFPGTDTSLPSNKHASSLPFHLYGVVDVAGFDATATHKIEDQQQLTLTVTLTRAASTKGWVLAMMAVYWLLALGALAVTLSIVLNLRPFETRQFAWLSALLFALIAFRTALPGSPPIGTFFDFYAMFEGVAIVAASLLTLMVVFLVRSRERLGI